MRFLQEHIKANGKADAAAQPAKCARVLVARGRNASICGWGPEASLFIPLLGKLHVSSERGVPQTLRRGQFIALDTESRLAVSGHGLWVAILSSAHCWRDLVGIERPMATPLLIPAAMDVGRTFLQDVIALARAVDGGSNELGAIAIRSIASEVARLQEPFESVISRCPGRSWMQRRNTFVRMNRAKMAMDASDHLDVAHFASIANYSVFHFTRAFKALYGKSPYAHMLARRLDRARDLLNTSPYAVYEIAMISGFEDRSAFARSFKKHFGFSASDIRRRGPLQTFQEVA